MAIDLSNFKNIYLLHERTFFENPEQTDVIPRLINLRFAEVGELYQTMVMQKIYHCYVSEGSSLDAAKVIDDFLTCMKKRFKVKMLDLKLIGHEIRASKKFIKASFFYQAYGNLTLQSPMEPDSRVALLYNATLCLRYTFDESLKEDPEPKHFHDHMIAVMHRYLEQIRAVIGANEPARSKSIGWSLSFLAHCYADKKAWKMVEKLNEEALQQMKDCLGETAARYWVFGVCAHHLAFALYNMADYQRAKEKFGEALEARIKAEDYRSADDRRKKIETSKNMLKHATAKCDAGK